MRVLYKSSQAIGIDFDSVLTERGIVKTDISEAIFIVKSNASDTDGDAIIDLRLGDGLEWDPSSNTLLAVISQAKWVNVPNNKKYLFGVGFKETGSTFIEASVSDDTFVIYPDFIRE